MCVLNYQDKPQYLRYGVRANNIAVQTEIEGITTLLAYSTPIPSNQEYDKNESSDDITVFAEDVAVFYSKKRGAKTATCAICKKTDSDPHNRIPHAEVSL